MSLVRMCDCCNKQISLDFYHVKGWKNGNGEPGAQNPLANHSTYIIARDLCESCWKRTKDEMTNPPPEAA